MKRYLVKKTNDGICVGLQETDEFIDEEKVEYMFDTEGDLQTGVQTDNGIDSLSDTETDSQTETETDSQITDADKACRSSEISVDLIIIIVFL